MFCTSLSVYHRFIQIFYSNKLHKMERQENFSSKFSKNCFQNLQWVKQACNQEKMKACWRKKKSICNYTFLHKIIFHVHITLMLVGLCLHEIWPLFISASVLSYLFPSLLSPLSRSLYLALKKVFSTIVGQKQARIVCHNLTGRLNAKSCLFIDLCRKRSRKDKKMRETVPPRLSRKWQSRKKNENKHYF